MEVFAVETWKYLASEVVLGTVALKGAAVAAGVAALGLALRGRASAGIRSALWAAGFGVLLLLPLLAPLLADRVAPVLELGVARYPEGLFQSPAEATPSGGGAGVPLAVWLGLAWAAGALAMLARFGLHVARIARVSAAATPVRDGPLAEAARQAARELGVGHVRLALSDCPGVPLTWGLFRPVILLPTEAAEWSPGLQRAVVHHEIAHVARLDYLGLVVMELARAIHWPNPLVWYLASRARMDQERACDDAAIRAGIEATDYARHLVAVARSFADRSTRPVGALPIVRRSSLSERVRAIMDRGASRRPATTATAVASLLMVATLSVPLAMANPWSCAEESAAVEEAPRDEQDGGWTSLRLLSLATAAADAPAEDPAAASDEGARAASARGFDVAAGDPACPESS